jgi:hypothetical protein
MTKRPTPTLKDAERYVGTPYVDGVFDCSDLTAKVQLELWGRTVALPTHSSRPALAPDGVWAGAVAQRIEAPVHGCVVLLHWLSGLGGELRWHVGTVFMQTGQTWVLHNSRLHGKTVLHTLAELRRQQLRLDGFYTLRVLA